VMSIIVSWGFVNTYDSFFSHFQFSWPAIGTCNICLDPTVRLLRPVAGKKSKEANVPIRFPIWLPIKQNRIYIRYMGVSGVALHKKLQLSHTD
jgi:hypothetical protein